MLQTLTADQAAQVGGPDSVFHKSTAACLCRVMLHHITQEIMVCHDPAPNQPHRNASTEGVLVTGDSHHHLVTVPTIASRLYTNSMAVCEHTGPHVQRPAPGDFGPGVAAGLPVACRRLQPGHTCKAKSNAAFRPAWLGS